MADNHPRRTLTRVLSLGPHGEPKRLPLDVLDVVLRHLRHTLEAIANDLGVAESGLGPVELVDFLEGSSSLAFRQEVPADLDDRRVPLHVTVSGLRAVAQGRPLPKILTARSEQGLREFHGELQALAASGYRTGLPENDNDDLHVTAWVDVTAPGGDEGGVLGVDRAHAPELPTAEAEEGASDAPMDADEPRWLLRFSADVVELDVSKRQMTFRFDGKRYRVAISDALFAVVDRDDARWQHVGIVAHCPQPIPARGISVVQIEPGVCRELHAVPVSTAAELVQPTMLAIRAFSSLSPGWDSYEADSIAPEGIRAATDLLALAVAAAASWSSAFVVPFAAPVARGSVQLEWEHDDLYLELEFIGKGRVAFMRQAEGTTVEGEVALVDALTLVEWFHTQLGQPP